LEALPTSTLPSGLKLRVWTHLDEFLRAFGIEPSFAKRAKLAAYFGTVSDASLYTGVDSNQNAALHKALKDRLKASRGLLNPACINL
jgi:hypothetical protein